MPKTLFEKIWDTHLVHEQDGNSILYIDRHLVHEVTSPQAFEGLRMAGRKVRVPQATFAVPDHNIPTRNQLQPIKDPISAKQVETLRKNCKDFGVPLFDLGDPRQGIVHVMGPEQGLTLPGSTIVCGDSHTATHGAFGALAFGIGTSEVEHVMATQTLQQKKPKTMLAEVSGTLPDNVTAKDIILAIIGKIGTAGGTGYVIEDSGISLEWFDDFGGGGPTAGGGNLFDGALYENDQLCVNTIEFNFFPSPDGCSGNAVTVFSFSGTGLTLENPWASTGSESCAEGSFCVIEAQEGGEPFAKFDVRIGQFDIDNGEVWISVMPPFEETTGGNHASN
jgi:hypothetical protein